METYKLPELAEGIEAGDVVGVLVNEGDTVEEGQSLIELETDKATVPVPAPYGGRIAKIHVKPGDKVPVGAPLVDIEGGAAGKAPAEKAAPTPEKPKEPEKPAKPAAEAAPPREEPVAAPEKPAEEKAPPPPTEQPEPREEKRQAEKAGGAPLPERPVEPEPASPSEQGEGTPIPAGPSVRRLARELGVDLRQVKGSGGAGRITSDDVKEHARRRMTAPEAGGPMTGAVAPGETPDFSRYGPVRTEPLPSMRRKISANMSASWSQIPHVHQFAEADVTDLMAIQKKYAPVFKERGVSLTMTSLILKAVARTLKAFPKFNASLDLQKGEVVYKDYIHIGVAVDTPAGLIVPVIRDVDKKDLLQLSVELGDIAKRTRERQVGLDELRGASFTVSNLGGIGGSHFTPIINPPEVAVLGVGRSEKTPTYRGDSLVPRMKLPLCVAYDHRLIDGADGARFIVELVRVLENFEDAMFFGL